MRIFFDPKLLKHCALIYFSHFLQGKGKDKTVISETTGPRRFLSHLHFSSKRQLKISVFLFRSPHRRAAPLKRKLFRSHTYRHIGRHAAPQQWRFEIHPCRDHHPLMSLYCRCGRVYLRGCDFRAALQQISLGFPSHEYTGCLARNLNCPFTNK